MKCCHCRQDDFWGKERNPFWRNLPHVVRLESHIKDPTAPRLREISFHVKTSVSASLQCLWTTQDTSMFGTKAVSQCVSVKAASLVSVGALQYFSQAGKSRPKGPKCGSVMSNSPESRWKCCCVDHRKAQTCWLVTERRATELKSPLVLTSRARGMQGLCITKQPMKTTLNETKVSISNFEINCFSFNDKIWYRIFKSKLSINLSDRKAPAKLENEKRICCRDFSRFSLFSSDFLFTAENSFDFFRLLRKASDYASFEMRQRKWFFRRTTGRFDTTPPERMKLHFCRC